VTKIVPWIVLVSWLSQIPYLLGMPSETTDKAVEAFFWEDWSLRVTMIAFGLAASVLALKHHRWWPTGVLLTSLAYVIYWWLFSGYFTVDMTLGQLFNGLWMKAREPGYAVITIHRDFLLISFYQLVVLSLFIRFLAGVFRGH